MAEILIPDIIQVTATGVNPEGHRWMNNYWRHTTDALTQSLSDAIAAEVAGAYAALAPRLSAAWSLDDFVCTDRRAAGAPQYHSPPAVPLIGALGDQPLPGMVNALIQWTTAFRGREGRGRSFFTGFTEASSNGGGIEGATQTALQDFADEILGVDYFAVVSLFKGVAIATSGSRRKKPIPRAVGVVHQITADGVPGAWYTQRRRRN